MSLQEYDFKKIGLFLGFLLVLVVALIGTGGSLYYRSQFKKTQDILKQASINPSDSAQTIIDKVGKLIKLPQGEIPTIATISDLSKLKDQAFFARAKVGDKVLLYAEAKKAVLYDPVDNVIVEVGPLLVPTGTPSQNEAFVENSKNIKISATPAIAGITASPSGKVKVAVYNGTEVTGITDSFASELPKKVIEVQVIQKTAAANNDYAKTLAIDISGNKKDMLSEVAKAAGAEISEMPAGEKKPLADTDILIILGSDKL
ncbi:MAG: hypothetical protein UV73_C0016G0005 [Candidatus Gottesmanbacteria bacterium GW2011_GWA2_43_14]|uniref:LytR/CpsA/Psr regulator C-terminal domain-containing protein n=1 Tax=Candidatus Gottesmanbacteria bacterium GW2011_GWA2_43_14 TaxID=1618443 RepID=A0A0G1DCX6_9BACT|nr:MAG: hypothetical protein UV73_C0016G0005 [Candidatus Gottesmanbacteria bacterium GW2011_GWA2_43_14]